MKSARLFFMQSDCSFRARNNAMNTLKGLAVALLWAVFLHGCGGGGSGGDGGGTVPLQPLVIDRNNAMQVAAAVVDTVLIVGDLDGGTPAPPAPAAVAAVEVAALPPALTSVIRKQMERFVLVQAPADFQIAAVIPPTEENCLVSGTFTISGNVADPTGQTLTAGDTLTSIFSNCNDGDGVVLNGQLSSVVVIGVDTDFTPPYDFTFDNTLTDFSVTESGETATANGDLTLREATADAVFFQTEASGNRVSVRTPSDTRTLRDYRILGTLNEGAGGAYTIDSGGLGDCCATLESFTLSGTVDFENTLAFAGIGNNFPFAGVLFITGAVARTGVGESSVEVIALDALCVDLFVDEDGDGGVDAAIRTTWASLQSGIPVGCVP